MNCNTMRSEILLAGSGELPALRRVALDRHLAGCAACRAYAEEAGACVRLVREGAAVDGPSAAVLATICERAGQRRGRAAWFPSIATRVLAMAATLTLVCGIGIFLWRAKDTTSTAEPDAAGRVHGLIALVHDETSYTAAGAGAEASADEVERLAEELLRLEGFNGESWFDTGILGDV